MEMFGHIAYDMFDRSFGNCPVGAGLLDNVFSKEEVEKMSTSSEPKEEIRKAFTELLPFEKNPIGERYFDDHHRLKIIEALTKEYFGSESFRVKENESPFGLLERYVKGLEKIEGVSPRVGRDEMYDRELFIVGLSKNAFRSVPNIGAICFFGSFVRGRVNPRDIDVAFYLKTVYPTRWVKEGGARDWKMPKSFKLQEAIMRNCGYKPDEESYKGICDIDDGYCAIEGFRWNAAFQKVAARNACWKANINDL